MTDEEFALEVLSYKGKYPEWDLKKFIRYYTEKKHFSKIPKFTLSRRLAAWFSPKRENAFKVKMAKKREGKTQEQLTTDFYKNFLGNFNPLR